MNAVVNQLPESLPAAFEPMRFRHQWFVYHVHSPNAAGKFKKQPIDPRTGRMPLTDHGGLAMCTDFDTAWNAAGNLNSAARPSESYCLGFWFTKDDPLFFLDIDACVVQDAQGTLAWSPLALELLAMFPGAAVEVSSSKRALHVIASGTVGEHECRNGDKHLEFYTQDRGVALTFDSVTGSAATDHTAALATLVANYFAPAPRAESSHGNTTPASWTTTACAGWHGPDDDAELIAKAKRSRKSLLWNRATFKDLWTADADKLADVFPPDGNGTDPYNASAADQSLANALAFWTGNNCARIERLMLESAMVRDKWDRRDNYLRPTILEACDKTANWFNDGEGVVAGAVAPEASRKIDDFRSYLPDGNYIYEPTREMWPAKSVDKNVLPWPDSVQPTKWLDRARPVHQMIWAPGEPLDIPNRLVASGAWIIKPGANTFNLYRPPNIVPGDSALAKPWLDLLQYVYPEHVDHIVKWFAHRRQHPSQKINHALVLGGGMGIGKDTIVEPLSHAVGPWNFAGISPKDLLESFNPYVKTVVLRVNEARDMGEMNRYALYEHSKTLIAAPPNTLTCNEKNLRQHEVFNVMGVIFTTNHEDGLYLPPDDRRHYVMWTERKREEFQADYWLQMYAWYEREGYAHVAAYLDAVDLTGFDPKAPPVKTPAFWAMVDAGRAPEDSDMADALEKLNNPSAITIEALERVAGHELKMMFSDRSKRRQLPHRFKAAGYAAVRNEAATDGLWKIKGKRQTIYARKDMMDRDRIAAAAALCGVVPKAPA